MTSSVSSGENGPLNTSGVVGRFTGLFGRGPDAVVSAPGRVNLIGEHTDYNDGFVLPLAVPLRTRVAIGRRADHEVHVSSRERDAGETARYVVGQEAAGHRWLDYVQGVTSILTAAGHAVGGFDLALESDVPLGSGLASSAAMLVAVARAVREAFALDLDDVMLARLAQRAEVEFVGARVGIMDQLCASLGDESHALFIDTQSLAVERVPFPANLELAVIGSGVAHSNAAGEYNTRRSECERACQMLGVASLRAVTAADLDQINALPEPFARRARHVVTENQRVIDTVAALKCGDVDALGPLLAASHASMRDDYKVSVPEIDLLVELASVQTGVVGARLTGGGFGGSIVVVTAAEQAGRVGRTVVEIYTQRSGRDGRLLVPGD